MLPLLAVVSLSLSFLLTGCQRDDLEGGGAGSGFELSLQVPAPETVTVYAAEAPASNECYIRNAAVLEVDAEGTVTRAEYVRSIRGNGTQEPSLRLTARPDDNARFVVVANFDPAVDESTVEGCVGGTIDDARTALRPTAAYTDATTASLATPLLLSGEGTWGSGAPVQMQFQVAKVSVALYPSADNISVEEFRCYASADRTVWNTTQLTTPSDLTPSDGKHVMTGAAEAVSGDDAQVVRGIYLYESGLPEGYTEGRTFNSVILKVNNPDTEVGTDGGVGYLCLTCDRMDQNGTTVTEYRPFERGRHYIFRVKKIFGRGYPTPEEALDNPGNVVYEVEITDDWSSSVNYNGQYAVVTAADSVYMRFPTTQTTDLARFGVYMPGDNEGDRIETARASLVRVDAQTKELVPVPTSEVQMFWRTETLIGTPCPDNVFTLPNHMSPTEAGGFTLMYNAGEEYVPGMYLHIEYGNMEKFIAVGATRFSAEDITATYQGGKFPTAVVSEVWWPGEAEAEPLPVKMQWVDDEGNPTTKPEWVERADDNSSVTIAAQTERNDSNEILRQTPSINTTSGHTPYNLSNPTGAATVQNTANCYVINAPGQYSLPLVYGNAVKNGAANPSAYTSSASGANVLQKFINHTGAAITDPYIYNNANCVPSNATLVWQDAPNLVTDIALSSDKHSITFDVAQATIREGNAVIAVRNASDQIMWSWHIWVTDYKLGDDLKTVTYSGTHKMLPVNLGWCDGTKYPGRQQRAVLTQDKTGFSDDILFTQTENVVPGNNPYFQWGRKDPMLPAANATNKTWYDAAGTSSTALATASWSTGNAAITNGILNPGTFCINSYMDQMYNNLWAIDNNATSENLATSSKTVYDPCPTGYKVPVNNAFRAFTTTGGNTSTASQINGTWNATSAGRDFKCEEGSVFFPASGCRYSSGALGVVGSYGYYWSAVPYSTIRGRYLNFNSTYVNPLNSSNYRSFGYPVRPVRE